MTFSLGDWVTLCLYLAAMVALGVMVGRRQRTTDAYMRASRRMPFWAAGLSLLATSLSVATFVGAPEVSYGGNLSYLTQSIGSVLAAIIVSALFLPAFYRRNVTTVYELLEQRMGVAGRLSASFMFLMGRVFASGARLFIASIPISLVLFGDVDANHLMIAIAVIAAAATAYTMAGGIRAIIWTDTAQVIILLGAVVAAIVLLLRAIDMPVGEIMDSLVAAQAADGSGKLTLIDTRLDPSLPFTLWTAIIGMTLLNTAALGTDQDLAQRMLTCASWRRAAMGMMLSAIVGVFVVSLFLIAGLLLWQHHQSGPNEVGQAAGDEGLLIRFLLAEAPVGVRGLVIAGVAAAAMSSLDSALGAMSSTTVWDFYKRMRPGQSEIHYVRATRIAVVLWGAILGAFACVCVLWQDKSGEGLLEFSLGVMTLAYGGLLGVFLSVLLTKRGNSVSAMLAMAAGFVTALLLQFPEWIGTGWQVDTWPRWSLAWRMTASTAVAFVVCQFGRPINVRGGHRAGA